jgi:rhodanese-related sulfurtransferase
MERVIEFSFNHPLLIVALAVVLAALIANEYMNYRRSRNAVVYCDRGQRTLKAVLALQAQGWETVHQLKGGIEAWREASMPTEGRS